jgi:uroporphyrinogen-III synthase
LKTLYVLVAIALLCLLLVSARGVLRRARLRRLGLYPRKGHARPDDVDRLLAAGYRVEAMRCYREVYGASSQEAREAIDGTVARQTAAGALSQH